VSSVGIDLGLKSRVSLRFECSTHQSHLVSLKHGFKQVTTADIKEMLNLIVTRVLPESFVVQIGFVNLNRRPLIAHHELLEVEEAQIPSITLLICQELGERSRSLN
jgi:hypothetical protein